MLRMATTEADTGPQHPIRWCVQSIAIDKSVGIGDAMHQLQGSVCFFHVLSDTRTGAVASAIDARGGPRYMARRKRSPSVLNTLSRRGESAVKATVKRAQAARRGQNPAPQLA